MAFTALETHEFDTGDTIAVGHNRHGNPLLVMDGPNGLETVICFNRVSIKENHIALRGKPGSPAPVLAGSLEGTPESYGDVGAWFLEHADRTLDGLGGDTT